jgi:hypothetical protein
MELELVQVFVTSISEVTWQGGSMFFDEKTKHIEEMTDKGIKEMYVKKAEIAVLTKRVCCLEESIPVIKQSFIDGEMRMTKIEKNQTLMQEGITLINHTLLGVNGIPGVVPIVNELKELMKSIKTFIDKFTGVLKVSGKVTLIGGFVGLVISAVTWIIKSVPVT